LEKRSSPFKGTGESEMVTLRKVANKIHTRYRREFDEHAFGFRIHGDCQARRA
jgi:hypothetical protein